MSKVSENIKFLRKQAGLTQEQLAEKVGIKRSLVGAYEEGRADPRLTNLTIIAEVFGVSLDALITKDCSKIGSTSNEKFLAAGNPMPKILTISVKEDGSEHIDMVPQKAAAGYLNGYSDPEYIGDLPKLSMPGFTKSGTFRAFEIAGDSMLPLHSGTIIIGKYVDDPSLIKNGKTYVLLSRDEGVVYKRVFNYAQDRGTLYLVSDNSAYSPYEIPVQDVIELWEAKAFLSTKMPEPGSQQEMTLEKLSGIVMSLQQEIIRLKEK
jgi:transcriptional regulator with XRE-family HTH domain